MGDVIIHVYLITSLIGAALMDFPRSCNLRSDFGAPIGYIPIYDGGDSLKRPSDGDTDATAAKRVCGSNECPPTDQISVSLPLEVLVIILQHIVAQIGPFHALKRYGSVSKTWREALLDNKLWNAVILGGHMNLSKALKWLCDYKFDVVKEICFNCWSSEILPTTRVKLMFAKVQRVSFNCCEIKPCDALKSFTKLKKLEATLSSSYIPSIAPLLKNNRNSLTEVLFWTAGVSFCQSLLKHNVTLVNLKTLELDNFFKFKRDSIGCLQKLCPKLQTLNISCCAEKHGTNFIASRSDLVGFPRLLRLGVSFSGGHSCGNTSWSNDVMVSLLVCSPQLQSLTIMRYCSSDEEFVSLVSPNLTELAFQSCGPNCGDLLNRLLSQCSRLKKLKCQFANDQVVGEIISSSLISTLEQLNLSHSNVTVDGVKRLLETGQGLKYIKLVHCLNIPMPARKIYHKERIQEFYTDITREPEIIIKWLS